MREVCGQPDMPSWSSVLRWARDHEGFQRSLQLARQCCADCYFDEILEIADSATADSVQESKLRIDARKWVIGKMHPSKYGERPDQMMVAISSEGAGGGPVKVAAVEWTIVNPPTGHGARGHSEGSGTPQRDYHSQNNRP